MDDRIKPESVIEMGQNMQNFDTSRKYDFASLALGYLRENKINIHIQEGVKVAVLEDESEITVVFGIIVEDAMGADFSAKVVVNKETREVLQVLRGG